MNIPKLDEVSKVTKAFFIENAANGFALLRRIPGTGTIRFLDYVTSLTEADREALLEVLAIRSGLNFFPPPLVRGELLQMMNHPALARLRETMMSASFTMGMRHTGVRMQKAMLSDPMSVQMMSQTRAKLDFTPRDDMPSSLAPDPDPTHLKPAKAPQLRKLIDVAFKRLFAKSTRRLPGGETGHDGVLDGTPLTVWIDFSNRGPQLRYGVSIPDESKAVFVSRLTYEDLLVANSGWDYLTEENAPASVDLLCELIVDIVRMRNHVKAVL